MSKVIVVDADRCYACLACVVECAYRRSEADPGAPLTGQVLGWAGCDLVAVGREPVPLVCNHCEDAPCMTVCPSGAIQKVGPSDAVVLDMERCIGCRACVMACPFGMMQMRPDGKTAMKCDLCMDRLAEGEQPVCVRACPGGALELRDVDEVIAAARKRAAAALRAGR
ncbi:MAG: 4Fe-4S binding protein [Armatimonadetes bacterium]|nr:4Fe-4S binding protein [Armatimonadota bacterium]